MNLENENSIFYNSTSIILHLDDFHFNMIVQVLFMRRNCTEGNSHRMFVVSNCKPVPLIVLLYDVKTECEKCGMELAD